MGWGRVQAERYDRVVFSSLTLGGFKLSTLSQLPSVAACARRLLRAICLLRLYHLGQMYAEDSRELCAGYHRVFYSSFSKLAYLYVSCDNRHWRWNT